MPTRYRFSLAHEIGHLWLHEDMYRKTTIETLKDFRAIQDALGEHYRWFEWHANAFAGLVLVPSDSLFAHFTRRVEEANQKGLSKARWEKMATYRP